MKTKTEFEKYLVEKGFIANTAARYSKFIDKKLNVYLHERSLLPDGKAGSIESLEHEELMQYIRLRKSQGIKAKTINLELNMIGYYLDFRGLPNVAAPVRIKGVQRRIPHDLFTEKQLDDIYNRFPESRNHWTHENTLKTYHLILGLKIYQGLQKQELTKLEISHLQPGKGKIYIPSTRRTNKRVLDLKPFQILPLHEYLLTERPKIEHEIDGNYLFHAKRLIRGMPRIKAMIQRYAPELKNLEQVRASVITNWLKHYNLRETQYMAGHRFVSSTERYRTDNLEDLQKELEKYQVNVRD